MKQRILLKNIPLTGSYGSDYFIAQLNEGIKEDGGSVISFTKGTASIDMIFESQTIYGESLIDYYSDIITTSSGLNKKLNLLSFNYGITWNFIPVSGAVYEENTSYIDEAQETGYIIIAIILLWLLVKVV